MAMKRRKFQGVLNILSFNRHYYEYGIAFWLLLIFILNYFKVDSIWIVLICLGFIYGLLSPLLASAYIYDFSGYYKFDWIKKLDLKVKKPNKIVNINAGFDETSFIMKDIFPDSDLSVFDFYDPNNHTEKAIVRARKVTMEYPNTKTIKTNNIPLESNSVDLVCVLSAAHEIRNFDERVEFLKECKRVKKENGDVIIVEHLRDTANFFAFSIGFTHFFSRSSWYKALNKAGFSNKSEIKFTPFLSIFKCS